MAFLLRRYRIVVGAVDRLTLVSTAIGRLQGGPRGSPSYQPKSASRGGHEFSRDLKKGLKSLAIENSMSQVRDQPPPTPHRTGRTAAMIGAIIALVLVAGF